MEKEIDYYKSRNLQLRGVIFFVGLLLYILGYYFQKKIDEAALLRTTLEQLQLSVEQEKEAARRQVDSLQQQIQQQDGVHLQLKDSLVLLEAQRSYLKSKADENKAAIHRIGDVDSLYAVVARHYRN